LVYWFAVLVEFLLVLGVLFIFIITDARTIKVLAKKSLVDSKFTYEAIEGNFFTGLKIKALSYNKKVLFDSAKVHWNPLALLSQKIDLKEVSVKGMKLENIIKMLNDLEEKESSSKSQLAFNFLLSLNNIHLDINPYIYEGVKFSSFVFETDKINIDRDFLIETEELSLYFNSGLVDVELYGKIDKNILLVDRLNLEEIDSKEITKLVRRLNRKKSSQKSETVPFFKNIKIKYIFATLKDVKYNPLSIKNTKLIIYNAEIDPYKNFSYKAKKVNFTGTTNFGEVNYNGYIKNSMIHSKGHLLLSKELFRRYELPLNYETLKKLSGTLKLNHDGVWLEAKHSSSKLLKIKSDFNLDVLNAEHKLYYDYADDNLTIQSRLNGKMSYANAFDIKNEVIIDNKGFRYKGEIEIPKVKALGTPIAPYLLANLKGLFHGDSSNFMVDLNSKFLTGKFETHGYNSGILELKSKIDNIALSKIIPNLPREYKEELIGVESKTFLDFNDNKKSKTELKGFSSIINLEANMRFSKPFKILFKANIPKYSSLRKIDKNINFLDLERLEGEVLIVSNKYYVKIKNRNNLRLTFDYDAHSKVLGNGILTLGVDEFKFKNSSSDEIIVKSHIPNLQKLINKIKNYYKIELPSIQGEVKLELFKQKDGSIKLRLESPHLKYVSDEGVDLSIINIYDMGILLHIDKNSNIEIEHYKFKIDENEYLTSFYSDKKSYLSLEGNQLTIKELWINDKALVEGGYNLTTSMGNLSLKSEQYSFKNKDFDLLFDVNLKIQIEKEALGIEGNIDIFGNTINYEIIGSSIVEDADIIIVQEMLENQESALNNLKLNLKIANKKPLKYISKDINIDFFNDLRVIKNYSSEILVTGMSTITDGYYQMEDKKFTLNESHIYFAGDPKKPLLDIKANYEKDEYTVHIFISGSTEEPIVNFNAEPYLTQQEILSLILFDGTGTSSGDGAEAYTLLGGTFAKGLIKSLGIDVDHLLLGTDANDDFSFEIGRKISKNVTVIYLHEDGKDGAKVRIEHNKNFETDIIIQPPNTSSIEFLYKQTR
jgi:translocation and assembly module TamB